jgi:protoporphyrinogen oxidase
MSTGADGSFDSVVIVGAGVCGLATALRLLERRPSLDVTLLEAESARSRSMAC